MLQSFFSAIIFFFSIFSFAQDYGWSHDRKDVTYALCRHSEPESQEELKSYFLDLKKKISSDNLTSVTYRGVRIENESPQLIASLVALTTPSRPRYEGDEVPAEISDLNSYKKIPSTCTKVYCISQALFGEFTGPAMIYLQNKYSLNTSPLRFDKSAVLSSNEIKSILLALQLLPPHLIQISINQKLTHIARNLHHGDPETIANSSMELLNTWTDLDVENQQGTVVHELAHNISDLYGNNLDTSTEWLSFSDWRQSSLKDEYQQPVYVSYNVKKFPSSYSDSSPAEDFAESVTAYRLNPHHLNKIAPDKYEFIKKYVFSGRQYRNLYDCKENENIDLQSKTENKQTTLDTNQQVELYLKCADSIKWRNSYFSPRDMTFTQCVSKELLRENSPTATVVPLDTYALFPRNTSNSQKIANQILDNVRHDLTNIINGYFQENKKFSCIDIEDKILKGKFTPQASDQLRNFSLQVWVTCKDFKFDNMPSKDIDKTTITSFVGRLVNPW